MKGKTGGSASPAKQVLFLRIETLADCFALHHLSQNGEIAGGFFEEVEIPFQLWWRIDEVPRRPAPRSDAAAGDTFGESLWKMIKDQFKKQTGSMSLAPANDHRADALLPDHPPSAQIGAWETGVPRHEVRPVAWERLLQRVILRPDPARTLSSRVVLMTKNRRLLIDAVRSQYRLQQGMITWTVKPGAEKTWLIRIDQPSRWAIDRLPLGSDDRLFNLVPRQEQVYLEAGTVLDDVPNAGAFGRFRFWENHHLFIDQAGIVQVLNPVWKPAVELIQLRVGGALTWKAGPADPIEIGLRLRLVEERQQPCLWRVSDMERLRRLLEVTGFERMAGFFAWFGDGDGYVLSRQTQVDHGLVTGLSEAFPAYHAYRQRVFLPLGTVVSPMLPEDRLFEAFGVGPGEVLVIGVVERPVAELPSGVRLLEAEMKPLSAIVRYLSERALLAAHQHDERFHFSFPAPRKRAVEVPVDLPGGKSAQPRQRQLPHAVEPETAKTEGGGEPRGGVAGRGEPAPGPDALSEVHLTLARIREIDRALLEDIAQPDLWRERGSLGRRMEDRVPSLVSELTAEVLAGDPAHFLSHLVTVSRRGPIGEVDPGPLLAPHPGEQDKGRFLAGIRRETVPAELWYAWNLAYGARFKDPDIFAAALEAMRSGFCNDQRRFFDFAERSFESGSAAPATAAAMADPAAALIQVMGFDRMSEIKGNIERFFGLVDRNEPDASRVLHLQMRLILAAQCPLLLTPNVLHTRDLEERIETMWVEPILPRSSAEGLRQHPDAWTGVVRHLEVFAKQRTVAGAEPMVAEWRRSLSRLLASCSLVELFTGDMFRQLYPSDFKGREEAAGIFARWRNSDPNWAERLHALVKKKDSILGLAKQQRVLLYLVTQSAPSAEFKEFIRKPLSGDLEREGGTRLHGIAMNADAYRLMQVYRMPVDEEELFLTMIGRLPDDPGDFLDFRDAADQIIQSLFISSSSRRQEWLDRLLIRALKWWPLLSGREDFQIDLLVLLSYLQMGLMLDLVPESLSRHHFQARRRSLWIDHAATWSRDPGAFQRWQEAWNEAATPLA